jgi:magnesium transporter
MLENLEPQYILLRIQEVNNTIESGLFAAARKIIENMPACDVALILESSPPANRKVLWELTDHDQQGDILDELNEEVKISIIDLMTASHLVAATEGMETDELAYILRGIPTSLYKAVLDKMDAQDRTRVEKALAYPEDTAGSMMNTDTITVRSDVSVDVVLRYLRIKGELPEATDTLYVVNDVDQLIGDVPLSTLLTVAPELPIEEVMDKKTETLAVELDEHEIARLFERAKVSSPATPIMERSAFSRIISTTSSMVIRPKRWFFLSTTGAEIQSWRSKSRAISCSSNSTASVSVFLSITSSIGSSGATVN